MPKQPSMCRLGGRLPRRAPYMYILGARRGAEFANVAARRLMRLNIHKARPHCARPPPPVCFHLGAWRKYGRGFTDFTNSCCSRSVLGIPSRSGGPALALKTRFHPSGVGSCGLGGDRRALAALGLRRLVGDGGFVVSSLRRRVWRHSPRGPCVACFPGIREGRPLEAGTNSSLMRSIRPPCPARRPPWAGIRRRRAGRRARGPSEACSQHRAPDRIV